MDHLFRDLPEAIGNTQELSARLEFTLNDLGYQFPRYPVPPGEILRLRRRTYRVLADHHAAPPRDVVEQRSVLRRVWDVESRPQHRDRPPLRVRHRTPMRRRIDAPRATTHNRHPRTRKQRGKSLRLLAPVVAASTTADASSTSPTSRRPPRCATPTCSAHTTWPSCGTIHIEAEGRDGGDQDL